MSDYSSHSRPPARGDPDGPRLGAETDGGPRRAAASGAVPRRVVLADDAPGMRRLMRTALDLEDDFEVVGVAANGAEAVQLARELQPDLVVMDATMPVMSGLRAISEVRVCSPRARVVILSGEPRACPPGASDHIDKATPLGEVVARLRALFALRADVG